MVKKAVGHLEVEQEELPNMPAQSPIGKAARNLMAVRDEIEEVNEALDKKHAAAKKKLLDLMVAENKDAIVVDGITFRRVHKDASDEVRILQKKGRKAKDED